MHSAGRLALSTIADQDLEVLDALHRTNIRGTFVVAQQAARRLRAGGAFVGMSTSVVGTQFPTYGAYVASKSAAEGMVMILAKELRGRDVTANVVAPGPTATELFLDGKTQEQIDALAKVPPLERLGRPGGHRRRRGVPGRARRPLGQRADDPRQRRDGLMTTPRVVLVTGASSGFGRLTAESLARAGNVVVAGMRAVDGRNAPARTALADLAAQEGLQLGAVELDVQSQQSVDDAVATVVRDHGRIDVLVQNAGHMAYGPAEAFTPEQFAALYDVNVVGAQRVARAALPHMRDRRSGLVVWVGSSSTRGGHPPFLAPYFAAKAGMDALAESYAAELIRFRIDTTIVVPGAFTSGTNHFTHAAVPATPHASRNTTPSTARSDRT